MKVVITDDSSTIRIKLSRFFKELGHQVVGQAENGYEALKLIAEHQPDLVTLDWVMPEMDGLTTLRAIRYENKAVLVIMVSSAATLANELAAHQSGANAFLKKPFDKRSLQNVLDKMMLQPETGDAA